MYQEVLKDYDFLQVYAAKTLVNILGTIRDTEKVKVFK
jgi:hypothetical protein